MALTPAQMRALRGGVPTQPTRAPASRVDTSTLAGVQAASTGPVRGTAQQQAQAAAHRADTQRAQDAVYTNRATQRQSPSDLNLDNVFGPPGGPAPGGPPATTPGQDASRPVTPPDYRDSAYNAQIASINRALQDYETGAVRGVQRFGEDFTRGLGSLGFRAGEGFEAAPDITRFRDLAAMQQAMQTPASRMGASRMGGSQGSWDYEGEINPFSSAARGTRTSRDEFAGRGTLRSSDFAQSYAEFQDRLNEQLAAMQTGRTRTLEDAMSGLVGQRGSAEERRESARLDAMNRAALLAAGGTS